MKFVLPLVIFILTVALSAQSTELSGRVYVVSNGHPNASDANVGDVDHPLETISKAASLAQPGDIIRVHEGTYRERVKPARGGTAEAPITYEAAQGETVIIKGSDVWTPVWTQDRRNPELFHADLDPALFKGGVNPYLRTISLGSSDKSTEARPVDDGSYPETLGQLFVNGQPYYQATTLDNLDRSPGSWMVNAAGTGVTVHFKHGEEPGSYALIELSVRDRIFCPYRRGLSYIHVRGFTMEHCANQGPFPQGGALSVRSGRHWVIENNTIRFAKTIGLDCGSETWSPESLNIPTDEADQKQIFGGGHLIRGNTISDNGLCGIAGWNHKGTLIVNNVLERNNWLGFPHTKGWEEWAAIKMHASDALIAGNLVRDNEGHGIWIDNGFSNAHITRNVVLNNRLTGIFLELGVAQTNRPMISNNVVGYTRSTGGFWSGDGIYTHDASNVDIVNNLLIHNAGYGVQMRAVTGRKYGGHIGGARDSKILNNLFIDNGLGQLSLPGDSEVTGDIVSDYNAFFSDRGNGALADFSVNRIYNRFDWDDATKTLENALKSERVPSDQWPDLETWRDSRSLTFPAWQAFRDSDRQSVYIPVRNGKSGFSLRMRNLELIYPDSRELNEMSCPVHADVAEDFYGTPVTGDTVIPGPFQNVGEVEQLLSLRTFIDNPETKLTGAERETRRQEQVIEAAASELSDSESASMILRLYDVNEYADREVWRLGLQNEVSPQLTTPLSSVGTLTGDAVKLRAKGLSGPSQGESSVAIFKAPKAGWYRYDVNAALSKRSGETAGFVRAQLFAMDTEFKNAKLLHSVDLNTSTGYKGSQLPEAFAEAGKIALKQGWYLGLRFQVISPGPASGGAGELSIDEFKIGYLGR